ncbi:hypothetical protein KRR40_15425 [Niabella defluvii]|nr:hypothetical protein KRR40_15425 [Niabella sp. I65]
MRTRFSDEGFWQPRLVTDEKEKPPLPLRSLMILPAGRQESLLLTETSKAATWKQRSNLLRH